MAYRTAPIKRDERGRGGTTDFFERNKKRIESIARHNNVDLGVARDMLESNIRGNSNYKGGGTADMNNMKKAYRKALENDKQIKERRRNRGSSEYVSRRNDIEDNPQRQLLKEQEDLKRKLEKQRQERINASVGELNNQRTSINNQYKDMARQQYILKMQREKGLKSTAGVRGITGGARETRALNIGSDYENAINSINKEKANAYSRIDNAINKVRQDGRAEQARQEAIEIQQAYKRAMTERMAQMEVLREQEALKYKEAQAKEQKFLKTIGAYSQDYQAEINRISAMMQEGDSSEAWKIPYLNAERNKKIEKLMQMQREDQQQAFENNLKLKRYNLDNYKAHKVKPKKQKKLTYNDLVSMFHAGEIGEDEFEEMLKAI